jgi:hypothetical protein
MYINVKCSSTLPEQIRIVGSVYMTNGFGCGSGRPKTLRIRIRNADTFASFFKDKKS